MPNSHHLGRSDSGASPFEATLASNRALLQIKSWLPAHCTGERRLSIGGRELPHAVGSTLPDPLHILCLSPCDWLLVSQQRWAFKRHIAAVPRETGIVLLDVTDSLAVLKVRGRATRDVLAKGCGLDFHPKVFQVGCCARTRLAQMAVVIDCVDDLSSFDLYVARSHLFSLGDWLDDAAVEFS